MKKLKKDEIVNFFEQKIRGLITESRVIKFKKTDEDFAIELINYLKDINYKIIDINEYMKQSTEDFNLKAPIEGDYKINDILVPIDKKRSIADSIKLNNLEPNLYGNNGRTVLLVNYNEQIIESQVIYEKVRYWLKDGKILALVIFSKEENKKDFCFYGRNASFFIKADE